MSLRILRSGLVWWSLVLAALAYAWLQSDERAYIGAFFTPAGNLQAIGSDNGKVNFFFSDLSLGSRERGLTFDHESCRHQDYETLTWQLTNEGSIVHAWNGFLLSKSNDDAFRLPGAWFRYLSVPYWFLMSLAGLLWLRSLVRTILRRVRHARRRRWLAADRCGRCGYRLGGITSDRCPECGEARPTSVPAAAEARPV